MSNLTVSPSVYLSAVAIRQDADGRYLINDLHKASGEAARHRPATWLQNQQTIDLAKECEKDGIPSIVSKQGLGTYVVKELVYAYAMWISPAFHLQVIRTFDSAASAHPMTLAEQCLASAQALVAIEREQARQATALAKLEQRIDLMDGDTGYQTVTAYIRKRGWKIPLSQARDLGIRAAKLAKDLGVQIGTVPDERFGTVNSYPIALLDEIVAGHLPQEHAA